MGDALDHIIEKGVPSAAAYPYAGRKGTCRGYIKAYMKIHYYTPFENATPEEIEGHLKHSPLPSVLYSPRELQYYVSGVYDSAACRNDKRLINHAAVIVGQYDDAWIVRFSVISDWGLQGHVLIAKGRCGLGLQSYEINSPFTIIK
nr:PREDICTED: cysteine proteinase ACP2-like [Bemisia tabaci]